ncbi:MAG TPA: UDP-N-acetylmuramoyl-tripeptide--D-alanyl-D-alanine ligase [Candidatus Omnitrophica bacterium]|nr:UDP-N-acetylmuramoyl-tripeptide--D-alanyl-D-alanine ligase [Candidatus Omnitrophota bacterium]
MSVNLEIDEIVKACNGNLIAGEAEEHVRIKRFSIDSRDGERFDCFIALKGRKFDGHNFISEAIAKGAKVIIFQKGLLPQLPLSRKNVFFIEVSDSYQAIYNLARYKRKKFKFPILGITGSTAKTTVKEICAQLLSLKYDTFRNYLNQNNLLGLSLNILNCDRQYEIGVFELGISQPGEMDLLIDILSPQHGLITNIGPSHLEFLTSEEKVFEEKSRLFQRLPPSGFGFYSKDDEYLGSLEQWELPLNFVTFGFLSQNKYWAKPVYLGLDGSEAILWNGEKIRISLLGYHNIFNVLAGIAVGLELGVPWEAILDILLCLKPLPGRFHYYSWERVHIIDDSYNSNPLSLRKALEFLSQLEFPGSKIAVLGDMLELGRDSEELHFQAGEYARNLNIHKFLCYGPYMENFVRGAGEKAEHCSQEEIIEKVLQFCTQMVLILFKASRAMKAERIIQEIKERIASNAI